MLIKGLAGTGKTTVALEVLRKICRNGAGYYLSTRFSTKSC
ncbi:MAG: gas vesicle protein GvpD P-loop domain-containing protein [Candidatus Baldrarchaeia archaeon]